MFLVNRYKALKVSKLAVQVLLRFVFLDDFANVQACPSVF